MSEPTWGGLLEVSFRCVGAELISLPFRGSGQMCLQALEMQDDTCLYLGRVVLPSARHEFSNGTDKRVILMLP